MTPPQPAWSTSSAGTGAIATSHDARPIETIAPFAGEDPRDAKLLELEARLAETERRLDEAAGLNRRPSPSPRAPDDGAEFPAQMVSTKLQQDDTNLKFEERLEELSGKVQAALGLKDTFPSFRLTGFTQLDGGWFSQDPLNRATVGDMQDGVGFRRARLAVQGYAAEFTFYQLEVDFAAAGRPSFFDTYVEQQNLPNFGNIRAGQYLQPFSVDAMSGFRNLPFLERSLPFLAFVPFRRVGVMASSISESKRTQWAYSVFRTGGFNNAPLGDSRFGTDFGNTGGYSFSTRATHLLKYDEASDGRYLWHLGAGYDFSELGANTAAGSTSSVPFYQARTGPEFFLGYPENVPATFGPTTAFAGTPNFVDT
ncbi:MAG TPA: porin, partial [Pirellulales bacterium]|nr:porin [Pirellulales bacterium]